MESTRNRLTTIRTWFCLTVGLSILLFFGGCAGPAYMTGAGNFHTVIVDAGHGGHDMGAKYKETSTGGLAVNVVEC